MVCDPDRIVISDIQEEKLLIGETRFFLIYGNNMTDNLIKLQRISGYISTILMLFIALIVMAIAVSLILLALCITSNDWMLDMFEQFLDGGLLEFEISVAMGIIVLVLTGSIMFIMHLIFSDIKRSYTPFKDENVRRLKQVSYILLVCSFILPIIQWAMFTAIEARTMIDFNPLLIAIAVLFYCISLVFAYGTKLQQESDETL